MSQKQFELSDRITEIDALFRLYCRLTIWEYQAKNKLPKDVEEFKDAVIKRIKGRIAEMTMLPDVYQTIPERPLISPTPVIIMQLSRYGRTKKHIEDLEGALELVSKELSEGKKPDLEKLIKDSYEQSRNKYQPK